MKKAKVVFAKCIIGYRAYCGNFAVATISKYGSVHWEQKTDALPVDVLAEVDAFACKIARDACSDKGVTA